MALKYTRHCHLWYTVKYKRINVYVLRNEHILGSAIHSHSRIHLLSGYTDHVGVTNLVAWVLPLFLELTGAGYIHNISLLQFILYIMIRHISHNVQRNKQHRTQLGIVRQNA